MQSAATHPEQRKISAPAVADSVAGNDIDWKSHGDIREETGVTMEYAVINLVHASGAPYPKGTFDIRLLTKLTNVTRIDIDSLAVYGIAVTGVVPDQPYICVSIDGFLVGGQTDTVIASGDHSAAPPTLVNDSTVLSGYPIVYTAGATHSEQYDTSGGRRQRPFFTARRGQTARPIEALRFTVKGPNGANPEFDRLTMRVCIHRDLNADTPQAAKLNADRAGIGHIRESMKGGRRVGGRDVRV